MVQNRPLPLAIYHRLFTNLSLISRHRNPVFGAAPVFELGEPDGQHAVLEHGGGGVLADGPAQPDGARELAEAALRTEVRDDAARRALALASAHAQLAARQ